MPDNWEGKSILLFLTITFLILLIFGPFFTIWSLNTLFGFQIPANFQTWLASSWLMILLVSVRFSVRHQG